MSLSPQQLAEQWMAAQGIEGKRTDEEWEPLLDVIDLSFKEPERLWQLIELVMRMQPSEAIKGALAAGPLEDLISEHGGQFIDRIADWAKADAEFAALLPKVWLTASDDPLTEAYVALGCDAITVKP